MPVEIEASEADVAWAAGFLDGEGHFGAHIRKLSSGYHALAIYIHAGQVNRIPLDKLVKIFGGRVTEMNRKTVSGRTTWTWSITSGARVEEVVKSLMPHLTTKKKEAKVLLKLCGTMTERAEWKCSPAVIKRREKMIRDLKELRAAPCPL